VARSTDWRRRLTERSRSASVALIRMGKRSASDRSSSPIPLPTTRSHTRPKRAAARFPVKALGGQTRSGPHLRGALPRDACQRCAEGFAMAARNQVGRVPADDPDRPGQCQRSHASWARLDGSFPDHRRGSAPAIGHIDGEAVRAWTSDGLVRQASFQGLREDKDPPEVTRET
jgi:hypothetical protein